MWVNCMDHVGNYSRIMGRLGHLVNNPDAARPGELLRITESYLTSGEDRRGRRKDFLSDRQERAKATREVCLGDKIYLATQQPGEVFATLPKLSNRPKRPEY